MKQRIIVIGGGLAGTAAAYWLVRRGYDVTIVERNDRLGGRIRSELVDGAAVEMGAGFMTNMYTNMRAFMAANGLDAALYRQHGSTGIFRNGKVRMATLHNLAGNGTVPWGAKIYALPFIVRLLASWPWLDLHAFYRAAAYDNQSVAAMYKGRVGQEFLEYVLQPILNGYCYWTPEHTSKAMLFMVCKGVLLSPTSKLRGGLQRIPERAAADSTVLLEHTATKVRRDKDGMYMVGVEHNGKRRTLRAHGIVCATTASVVPKILAGLTTPQREFFAAIRYSSTALIARTYRQSQTCGTKSIAFPRREGVDLAAMTLSPEPGTDVATLKTYASGTIGKELCNQADPAVIQALSDAMEPVLHKVLIGNPEPLATHLQRWAEALPLFDVGHFKRLQAFEDGAIEDPKEPIVFAGDYIGGPFMEGAFTSGLRAAERLDARLSGVDNVAAFA